MGEAIKTRRGKTQTHIPAVALYWEGDEITAVTGGWVQGYKITSLYDTNTLAKNQDNLEISIQGTGEPSGTASQNTFVTFTMVDLTGIDTLYMEWSKENALDANMTSLVASSTQMGDRYVFDARFTVSTGNQSKRIDSLDVSALSGMYYIRVHNRSQGASEIPQHGTLKVYRLWGE